MKCNIYCNPLVLRMVRQFFTLLLLLVTWTLWRLCWTEDVMLTSRTL